MALAPGRPGPVLLLVLLAVSLVVAAAQPERTDISTYPGCGKPGAALEPGMQDCVVDELMGSNGTMTLGFTVGSQAKAPHSLLLTLRSVGGAAIMRVLSGSRDFNSRVVYYNDAVTESFLRIPGSELTPGEYTVEIQGMGGATQKMLIYLRVQTPPSSVKLASADRAAMLSVMRECCPAGNSSMAPDVCTTFLPAALNAAKPEDDLCNIADFVCNEEGQLQKIDLSNAGLQCKRFPAAFGKFAALETLMLRFNDFGEDSFENVAKVLSTAPDLRRLMMGATNITGTVPCRLFEEHALRTVMLSVNKLEGGLPECVLASTTLEELYMSRTSLTGELPDAIPIDSQLRVWYAINEDPITGARLGPGFSGTIPSSIANAGALAFAELSGHELTGGVPALPAGMKMFEAHSNLLDGGIASPLPTSMVYFDVMNNSLTGPLPDFSEAREMALVDMSRNQLEGELPSTFGAAGGSLVFLDLHKNQLEGSINQGDLWGRLPTMRYVFLQENRLTGSPPASLASNFEMTALNLAFNSLDGDLEAFAGAVEPPKKQSRQQGRRLSGAPGCKRHRHDANYVVAKKLIGSNEGLFQGAFAQAHPAQALRPGWHTEQALLREVATGQLAPARRRLLQNAGMQPAVPVAPAAQAAPVAPAAQAAPVAPAAPVVPATASQPAPGGATTSVVTPPPVPPVTAPVARAGAPTGALPVALPSDEPVPQAAPLPAQQDPTASAAGAMPANEPPVTGPTSSGAMAAPAGLGPQGSLDMAPLAIPAGSALSSNNYLYLNMSHNALTGPVPAGLGNLEMFRSPANSSDPFDQYVYARGGPDRSLDLTFNQLYGEFPMFIVEAPADLADACICLTTFNVSEGNSLYCPTEASLQGMRPTASKLQAIKRAGYTCMLPKQPEPVALASYLARPADWISSVPSRDQLPAPSRSSYVAPAPAPRSTGGDGGGSGSGQLSGGAIAGIVIGSVAGAAILASLAYFVGYKRFYQVHKVTSFKRTNLPEGPGFADGTGAYPSAAYGAGGQHGLASNGSADIEMPGSGPARPM